MHGHDHADPAARPGALLLSAGRRLGFAGAAIAALWLAVLWAL
jgi:hypothetical protein